MGFNINEIPPEMKAIPNWVCWKAVPDPKSHSGVSKRPVNPWTGGNAQSNNPETWADFDTACNAAQSRGLAGIGFMFSNTPFFGVDVDDRPLDSPEVQEILTAIPSYAELSQSGHGVHIICSGSLPGKGFNNHNTGVEMYENGRFFVVTGNRVSNERHVIDCTEQVKPVYALHDTHKEKPKPGRAARPSGSAPAAFGQLDKDAIIRKALNSRQGQQFGKLLSGDISGYKSQSEAEMAFCNMLAFWTGRNPEMMDAIFRESGMMREKWDRKQTGSTYGAITIQKAIDELQSAYGERRGVLTADAFGNAALDWNDTIGGAGSAPTGTAPATAPATQSDGAELTEAAAATVPDGMAQSKEKPLPWFFYYDQRDNLRVDPAKLKIYFQTHERYFWAANEAMDGVRRYFYNPQRGVYELLTDDRIKGRIKSYITKAEPTAVKVRDVNEVYNNLITDECRQPDSTLDSTENLVNFQNGLFDLITWSIYPHQPSVISTVQIPLTFDPSRAYTLDDAPTFRNYLHDLTEGDAQKQQLLLEYMGAALSNIPGYKFKQALFLVGAGDTGKSQYIKLICALLGEINSASVSFSDLAERFQTGAIYGKRIICDADMKVQRAKDNGLFMKITGGDPIQIEYKGMNHFTTIHRGYLLFASNALPKWGGNTTEAAYNRMLIVECDNVIPPERRDPHLLDKLLAERQAIVYLAFQALVGAVQRGYRFTQPDALALTMQQLRRNNCPSVDFFTSQCVEYDDAATNKKHWIRKTVLHRIFAEWCRVNAPSAYIPNEREFYRDILQYKRLPDGALKKKVHPGVWYYTFTLTPDAKEEFGVFDSVE